jgi:Uma2 family endonuclease
MASPAEKNGKFTYGDYLSWTDEERWELIDGQAYNMTLAPSREHQGILGALFYELYSYLRGKPCKVYPAPFDVRLPEENQSEDEITTVVQPDLTVICDPSKLDKKGCLGSPDLIIEIISPSTLAHDYQAKLALYERHQVPEYWIVHPIDRIVMVFLLQENGEYGKPRIYAGEDQVSVNLFPDLIIDLKDIFTE